MKLGAVATLLTLAATSSTQKELRQELRSGTWGEKHIVLIDLIDWLIVLIDWLIDLIDWLIDLIDRLID